VTTCILPELALKSLQHSFFPRDFEMLQKTMKDRGNPLRSFHFKLYDDDDNTVDLRQDTTHQSRSTSENTEQVPPSSVEKSYETSQQWESTRSNNNHEKGIELPTKDIYQE
jgi:hypothetical protein